MTVTCLSHDLQVYQVMPTQLHDMNSTHLTSNFSIGLLGHCEFLDEFSFISNVALVLLLIPVLNFLLFPFMREYMPNMLKRIGMGVVLTLLAQVSILAVSRAGAHRDRTVQQCMFHDNFSNSTAVKDYQYTSVSEYYVLLPHVLLTVAEVLVNITSKKIKLASYGMG